ncbi:hypothetical protein COS18_03200, partial [Candidatus Falkowbacteria bacterium CG02_land_8_20_14_3_00_36_14]
SAPQFTSSILPAGKSGVPYSGFISAADADGDPITWTWSAPGPWPQWQATPILRDPVPAKADTKEVYSPGAGQDGAYQITVTIDDGRGLGNSVITKTFTINVSNYPPVIPIISDFNYTASATNPINFSFTATDNPLNIPPLFPFIAKLISPPFLPPGFLSSTLQLPNSFVYAITGSPNAYPANTFNNPTFINQQNYLVDIINIFNAKSMANFNINIINHPPTISTPFPCSATARIKNYYACQISASDSDGNNITYSLSANPAGSGLNINGNTGLISGISPLSASDIIYTLTVITTDEYGYSSLPASFILNVQTYCGDGIAQILNGEKTGGLTNNGDEECDDGNVVNNDACHNNCTWYIKTWFTNSFNIDATLTNRSAVSAVYDDDRITNQAANDGGNNLKVFGIMETPYIWVVNSTHDLIAKIRTFIGPQVTSAGINYSIIESRGQYIGSYPVGDNPSRTSVNAETGDVWVANRNSSNITKLNIDGTVIKTCPTGSGPRGVAIEQNGDAWIANANDGTLVKIPGGDYDGSGTEDNSDCNILVTASVGGFPYGLAMDSNNDIWISNRDVATSSCIFQQTIQKYNTQTGGVTNYGRCTHTLDLYGITVDLNDNVWAAKYVGDANSGVYKLDAITGIISEYVFSPAIYPVNTIASRGVSIDTNGSIWMAVDGPGNLIKIPDPNNPLLIGPYNTGGITPIGVAGDSAGQIWTINYTSASITALDSGGNILAPTPVLTYDPLDLRYASPPNPYTYSDMTGLNRAMIFRSGVWKGDFNSGYLGQKWGNIRWKEIIPSPNQTVTVEARASDNSAFVGVIWITVDQSASPLPNTWDAISYLDARKTGQYLQIRIILRSSTRGITPVVWDLEIY